MTLTEPVPPSDAAGPRSWHLRGNFGPVSEESTVDDLEVYGSVPPALNGRYLRIGPNPRSGSSPHWFFGDGMVHGVELRDGHATWYRNRYVRTTRFSAPERPMVADDGSIDRVASAANTHIVRHAGRILALEEAHLPWEVDAQLETVGVHDFGGRLATAMTAHPKICPVTGEMLFFGYSFAPPYLTYHRASAAGELVQSTEITVAGPTMIHDFNITENFVVFMDLPVVFDLELAIAGTMPYRWDDEYGARLGVMPRDGSDADVTWFEIEPCYVFHPMNAFETDGGAKIVLDVARFPRLWVQGSNDIDEVGLLHRWVIDRRRGTVAEEPLDDRPAEFARVADAVVGRPHRFGYMLATRPSSGGEAAFGTEIVKYDLEVGTREAHDFGPGRVPGEAVFAANPDAGPRGAEDDGWCMTFVHDAATDRSELVIVAAQDFSARPVAQIPLPVRVPFGFHGSWLPDAPR